MGSGRGQLRRCDSYTKTVELESCVFRSSSERASKLGVEVAKCGSFVGKPGEFGFRGVDRHGGLVVVWGEAL